jgi:hypothetical protein
MTTVNFMPRLAARRSSPLNLPQGLRPKAVLPLGTTEFAVSEETIPSLGLTDDAVYERLPQIAPLPSRQCVLLLSLGSLACYGLGYAVVAAFNYLLAALPS